MEDAKKGKEESHIHKHATLEHPGEDVTFSMKVIRKHKSCFARQVHEAVLIEMAERENLLNSKNTFNRCSIPRLTIVNTEKKSEIKGDDITESEIKEIFERSNTKKIKQRYSGKSFGCEPPSKRRCMTRNSSSKESVCTEEKDQNDFRSEKTFDKKHQQESFPSLPLFSIFTQKSNQNQTQIPKKRNYNRKAKTIIPPKDFRFKSLSSHFVRPNDPHKENPG